VLIRLLATSLLLAWASLARADAVVELVPQNGPGPFPPNSIQRIDVRVRQSPAGADRLLRHVQFNMADTNSGLALTQPVTHSPASGDIRFWHFGSTTLCAGTPAQCGGGHYVDGSLSSGPPGVGIAYFATTSPPTVPDDLGPNPAAQIRLLGNGTAVKVGVIDVTMPAAANAGPFRLDVMNADSATAELAARLIFGFEANPGPWNDPTPVTTWGATGASPKLTGGTLDLFTGAAVTIEADKWMSVAVHGAVGEATLEIPADDTYTEPRRAGVSKLVVHYSGPVNAAGATASIPAACDVNVQPVDLSGVTIATAQGAVDEVVVTFSPKLPGSEPTAHVPAKYRIVLSGVTDLGGTPVANTERTLTVVLGDAFGNPLGTGDGRVTAADNGLVRSMAASNIDPILTINPVHVRGDVFTDGKINAADNGLVRALAAEGLDGQEISLVCP